MENSNYINLNDYQIVFLCDTDNVILLNKKHTIEEFQEEVNRAKEKAQDDILKYGYDWYFISQNISEDFDYIELYNDNEEENNTIMF